MDHLNKSPLFFGLENSASISSEGDLSEKTIENLRLLQEFIGQLENLNANTIGNISKDDGEFFLQKSTMSILQRDVVSAYRIFLGREPESVDVINPRVGVEPANLLLEFLSSHEFSSRPEVIQLLTLIAKKILEARSKT
ncbi:hypothetical protein ICN48_10895 [Polynucleobacter sp. JS-Safj-400b-B2]|uniref:hypothetical protein n=1 Tax=Polynucleobacter sp. JS-Safj-400b-B2 TaxID=2576921 RepID=UPI001C0E1509|nr:hypothetical protein [Polynucleobacter sp. JS-Safj-400b-B2]MBU3626738.1 hypothetical protein [Polynucleobacter sp. JS-Safj-400b-B2]